MNRALSDTGISPVSTVTIGSTGVRRRVFVHSLLGAVVLGGLASCARGARSGPTLALDAPLPTTVPPDTGLSITSYQGQQELQLKLAGLADHLPFTVTSWPSLSAGPDVINAFRARSLDIASNAGIPPIQAQFQGYPARIVAVEITRSPKYIFATKPGSDIRQVADFRGKKIAFSQGQAQGPMVLRAIRKAGLADSEISLIPLTSDQFFTALQSGQVDVAPLSIQTAPAYFTRYARDGARRINTDVVDLLTVLWSPVEVLENPAKAAAIAAFIPLWAQALVWVDQHKEQWATDFYVDTQNISPDQARTVMDLTSRPVFPPSWDEAITWEQQTADLLAQAGFIHPYQVDALFDRRFETLAAHAVPDAYRK